MKSEVYPDAAKQELELSYKNGDRQWKWFLVAIILGEVSEKNAFNAIYSTSKDRTVRAQRLTEAYFYLDKRYQSKGTERDLAKAVSFYKLAISFNVFDYVEHRYAFLEPQKIYEQIQKKELSSSLEKQASH